MAQESTISQVEDSLADKLGSLQMSDNPTHGRGRNRRGKKKDSYRPTPYPNTLAPNANPTWRNSPQIVAEVRANWLTQHHQQEESPHQQDQPPPPPARASPAPYRPPHHRAQYQRQNDPNQAVGGASQEPAHGYSLRSRGPPRPSSQPLSAQSPEYDSFATHPDRIQYIDEQARFAPIRGQFPQRISWETSSSPSPAPTEPYLQRTLIPTTQFPKPRPLLVILDLNGTLLHRPRRGSSFTGRRHLHEFLDYLLANHRVLIWSSAQPDNVTNMCDKLFTKEQRDQLVGQWARDTLHLSPQQYNNKVQVYKRLTWAWDDAAVQATFPKPSGMWGQGNTVLIDDSVQKAASEPFNQVCVDEFENKPHQRDVDVLGQVMLCLERLKWEKDVSAALRARPFVYEEGATVDWERRVWAEEAQGTQVQGMQTQEMQTREMHTQATPRAPKPQRGGRRRGKRRDAAGA